MRVLFALAIFLSLFAFIYTQKYKLMPNCKPPLRRNTEYKPTTFIFMIDRKTYWRYLERYLYILKQLSCLIPDNDAIRVMVLDYSDDMQLISREHKSTDLSPIIYTLGWETNTINYDFCTRYKESAGKIAKSLLLYMHRTPVTNIQFVVPIIGDAMDANNCTMSKLFEEFYENHPNRAELHFNGISIHGPHNIFNQEKNVIVNIDRIGRIDPAAASMTDPHDSPYVRDVKPIVKKLQDFVNDKISLPVTVVPSNTTTTTTEIEEALPLGAEEEQGQEEFLLLVISILGGIGGFMIIICLCCWLLMCKNSADKKKESKLRSAEATLTPSKEKRSTPPRVSLSGMDSIDELYDTPMTQTPVSGTPLSRTPVSRTPTTNTPQKISYGATPQRSDRGY